MTDETGESERQKPREQDPRQDRLKLALRENLKRRKSQARGKGDYKGDLMPTSSVSDEVVGEGDEENPG